MKYLKLWENNFEQTDRWLFSNEILNHSDPFTVYELKAILKFLESRPYESILYGNQSKVNIDINWEKFVTFSSWSWEDSSPIVRIFDMIGLDGLYHTMSIIKGDDLYFWIYDWHSFTKTSSASDGSYTYWKCDDITGVVEFLKSR